MTKKKIDKKKKRLTSKQKLWCEFYMQHWNATQAAEDAKYKGKRSTLAQVGYENLRKPYIREYIDERLSQTVMSSNEVLSRLGAMARSFDVTDYATTRETFVIGKDGEAHFSGYAVDIDTKKLQRDGYSHLVKRIYASKGGSIVIEWHDQRLALVDIGRHYKLFQEKFEIPEEGLIVKVIGFDSDKI